MPGGQDHWDGVHGARPEDALTWFGATPSLSMACVQAHAHTGCPVVDIGAAASPLVNTLLDAGSGR